MDSVQRQNWHEELTFILFCLPGQENSAGQRRGSKCLVFSLIPHSNKNLSYDKCFESSLWGLARIIIQAKSASSYTG